MSEILVKGDPIEVTLALERISALVGFRKSYGWPLFQLDEEWFYYSEEDTRVCLPKNIEILTINGSKPINKVKINEMVLTRHGWKKVTAIHKRRYFGKIIQIKTELGTLLCTETHPLWVDTKGWTLAKNLKIRDHLKTANNELVQVLNFHDFRFLKSDDRPSILFKELVLLSIFNRVMPIFPINLNSYLSSFKNKINRVSANLNFLFKRKINLFKTHLKLLFQKCFTMIGAITRKTTKLSIDCAGNPSKFFSTVFTDDNDGGPTTFLTTILSINAFFFPRCFSTAFTNNIFSILRFTFPTTNSISMSNRFKNIERLTTNGTNLYNPFRLSKAFSGTKRLGSASMLNNKYIPTIRTSFFNSISLGKVITLLTTILSVTWTLPIFLINKIFPTIKTGRFRLSLPFSDQLHQLLFGYIHVYNLTVEGASEFYANNILVHNCSVCQTFAAIQQFNGDEVLQEFPDKEVIESTFVKPRVHITHPELYGTCRCRVEWPDPIPVLVERLNREMRVLA